MRRTNPTKPRFGCFSALQRAEIAEIQRQRRVRTTGVEVSVLFNEPKLLKWCGVCEIIRLPRRVSVLFNEPKLLKSAAAEGINIFTACFSALQRAEIAEIDGHH